jgi:hypothetical protein
LAAVKHLEGMELKGEKLGATFVEMKKREDKRPEKRGNFRANTQQTTTITIPSTIVSAKPVREKETLVISADLGGERRAVTGGRGHREKPQQPRGDKPQKAQKKNDIQPK